MAEEEKKIFTEEENDRQSISLMLVRIGVPIHLNGHIYLRDALMITMKHPEKIHHITKEIYPEIALKYRKSPACIERSIRTALEIMWNGPFLYNCPDLLEYSEFRHDNRPSNSEFISVMMDYMDLLY